MKIHFDKFKPIEWKNDYIDFKSKLQISNNEKNKRITCNRDYTHLRKDRFTFTPINLKQVFNGLYDQLDRWVR